MHSAKKEVLPLPKFVSGRKQHSEVLKMCTNFNKKLQPSWALPHLKGSDFKKSFIWEKTPYSSNAGDKLQTVNVKDSVFVLSPALRTHIAQLCE